MESAIDDEVTSINSIYGDETLLSTSPGSRIYVLRLPSLPSIILRCEFPEDYPDAPPSILGTETIGDNASKGLGKQVVDIARSVLGEIYRAGEPCVFDLVEELGEALIAFQNDRDDQPVASTDEEIEDTKKPVEDLGPAPPWSIAAPIIEKKSVFVARAAYVTSPNQAKQYLHHLVSTDKKVAKATHNITAWRIRGQNETSFQDCDDDGETAAGARLLHLMQLMDAWDVVIIVTRWYGGVLLGPDRFRIINAAARDALVTGHFVKDGETTKKKGK